MSGSSIAVSHECRLSCGHKYSLASLEMGAFSYKNLKSVLKMTCVTDRLIIYIYIYRRKLMSDVIRIYACILTKVLRVLNYSLQVLQYLPRPTRVAKGKAKL